MFFDPAKDIMRIAQAHACAILVFKNSQMLRAEDLVTSKGRQAAVQTNNIWALGALKNARVLTLAKNKKTIGVEEVREFVDNNTTKQQREQFLIINPADALTEPAENALLKSLEEPGAWYHYLLITSNPGALLPTIRSRAAIFFEFIKNPLEQPVATEAKVADIARALIKAGPTELPALAEKISKDKDSPRALALKAVGAAIEILEKSYFKTEQVIYLKKMPKFVRLYEALEQNGHVKLHIVADLC